MEEEADPVIEKPCPYSIDEIVEMGDNDRDKEAAHMAKMYEDAQGLPSRSKPNKVEYVVTI